MKFHGKKEEKGKTFYGATTMGEKGQVVMPIKARKDLKLEKGEQLLVFGTGEGMVAFVKIEHVERIAAHLAHKLKMIDKVVKNAKKKKA